MKIKSGFLLKEIAGSFVVVPVRQDLVHFSSMVTINETGAFLWKLLENGSSADEMCQKLLSEYEGISKEDALNDINDFVNALKENNILE